VAVAPVTPEARRAARLPDARGALVAEVVPDSAAAAAGIKPGDVIVAYQGEKVDDPRELTRRVAATPPGTTVKVEVARVAGVQTLTARVTELKEPPTAGNR
jgi:serine protease Do